MPASSDSRIPVARNRAASRQPLPQRTALHRDEHAADPVEPIVGCPLRTDTASMVRSPSPDSIIATATRSYGRDAPAASISPKGRYTSPSVRPCPRVRRLLRSALTSRRF